MNATPSSVPAVEVAGVAKRFGDVQALCEVDLRVEAGEFFGLLGPNGAGKTTLISILAGLARPDRGAAFILGHDVATDYRAARRALGVVPQELVFDPFFTVRETLRIQSGYFGLRRNDAWIDELLHHLDLTKKADANMAIETVETSTSGSTNWKWSSCVRTVWSRTSGGPLPAIRYLTRPPPGRSA